MCAVGGAPAEGGQAKNKGCESGGKGEISRECGLEYIRPGKGIAGRESAGREGEGWDEFSRWKSAGAADASLACARLRTAVLSVLDSCVCAQRVRAMAWLAWRAMGRICCLAVDGDGGGRCSEGAVGNRRFRLRSGVDGRALRWIWSVDCPRLPQVAVSCSK